MTPEDRKTIDALIAQAIDRLPSEPGNVGMGTSDDHAASESKTHDFETRLLLCRALALLHTEPVGQEPKVMTDETIDRIAAKQCPPLGDPWSDEQKAIRDEMRANVKAALIYARDNNLLAPLDRSRMEEAGNALWALLKSHLRDPVTGERGDFHPVAESLLKEWVSACDASKK